MDSRPWVDKYRPESLEDVKGHTDIVCMLKNYGSISKIPHLLFHGPPGTGKTSTIHAMARSSYKKSFQTMVLEINASDERGVETVLTTIKVFVGTRSFINMDEVKLVILDEADALTVSAQSALRRIIEKNTKNVRFCICCNYIGRISSALQSRCTTLRFSGLTKDKLEEKILEISSIENININIKGLKSIVDLSMGDTRRAINLLQTVGMSTSMSAIHSAEIGSREVYMCSGCPTPEDIESIKDVLIGGSFSFSFHFISNIIVSKGYSLTEVITNLSRIIQVEDELSIIIADEFSNIEYRICKGGSDRMNIGALVSSFH